MWLLLSILAVLATLPSLQWNYPPGETDHRIHIVLSIRGEKTLLRAQTMLKSMLVHRGRYHADDLLCHTAPLDGRQSEGQTDLFLHILADSVTKMDIERMWGNWTLIGVHWMIYDVSEQLEQLRDIPNWHSSGPMALLKLELNSILPSSVPKVIWIDSDVLLNANIEELWRHFEKFDESQTIGVAYEYRVPRCTDERLGNGLSSPGVNSGVALMHLTRLKRNRWEFIWKRFIKETIVQNSGLGTGDQTVINAVLWRHPEMFYQLPCEWNVQLYLDDVHICCPVFWTLDTVKPQENISELGTMIREPKLVHYNLSPKPGDDDKHEAHNQIRRRESGMLTVSELRATFHEYSDLFRSIPWDCFR